MSRRKRSEPETGPLTDEQPESEKLVGGEWNNLQFDGEAWAGFTRTFQQVQDMLNQNRVLIGRINQNHQSGISDRIASNVQLINHLNRNLSKVHRLYASATASFNNSFSEAPVTEDAEKTALLKPGGEAESAVVTDATMAEKHQRVVPSASCDG